MYDKTGGLKEIFYLIFQSQNKDCGYSNVYPRSMFSLNLFIVLAKNIVICLMSINLIILYCFQHKYLKYQKCSDEISIYI